METKTETLIEVMNNPISSMKDYHKGRLQGRLDILKRLHNEHHSYKSCGRSSYINCEKMKLDKFTCSMGIEIKNIEFALGVKNE